MSSVKTIKQFEKVVSMLGGGKSLSIRLGLGRDQSGQAVHIWKKDKKFPAKHYFAIQYMLLRTQDCVAAATLFSFNETGVPPAFRRDWVDTVADPLSKKWNTQKKLAIRRTHKSRDNHRALAA
jgi:hypothetical protein